MRKNPDSPYLTPLPLLQAPSGSTGCSKALGKFGRTVVGKVTGSVIASLILIALTASVTVYLH